MKEENTTEREELGSGRKGGKIEKIKQKKVNRTNKIIPNHEQR